MSSIFSTQKRHTFLRRKYCFLVAIALSPPVGRCDALMGLPPLCSGMVQISYCSFSGSGARGAAGAAGAGAPGMGAPGIGAAAASPGGGADGVAMVGGGRRAARFSRAFLRFSIFFIF